MKLNRIDFSEEKGDFVVTGTLWNSFPKSANAIRLNNGNSISVSFQGFNSNGLFYEPYDRYILKVSGINEEILPKGKQVLSVIAFDENGVINKPIACTLFDDGEIIIKHDEICTPTMYNIIGHLNILKPPLFADY